MPPPSSGGLAVAQALGMLENFDLSLHKPTALDDNGGKPTVFGVHLVAEAQRLAYADRDKYVADTDFVPLPGGSTAAMLDKAYLRSRASLIDLTSQHGHGPAGQLRALRRWVCTGRHPRTARPRSPWWMARAMWSR
jgi:gamma-glutamyltranspeptidase/glutathione hydrolase